MLLYIFNNIKKTHLLHPNVVKLQYIRSIKIGTLKFKQKNHKVKVKVTPVKQLNNNYVDKIVKLTNDLLGIQRTPYQIRNLIIALLSSMGLIGLVFWIFRDFFKSHLSEQTADVAQRSLNSQQVQMQVNTLSSDIVKKLSNDPIIIENLLRLVITLLNKEESQLKIKELAKNATLDILADPQVKNSTIKFIEKITNDDEVQKSTGNALWKSVKFSLTPSFMRK